MKINYSDLQVCHDELNNIYKKMKDCIDNISSECSSIEKNVAWKSSSSSHYVSKFNKILKNFDSMYDDLMKTNTYLENSYSNYQGVDDWIMSKLGKK